MKLNNEQDAIKQAVEAGYEIKEWPGGDIEALQDPDFWIALGKARGWCEDNQRGEVCPDCSFPHCENAWKDHALRYFDTKLSGGDTNQFFKDLP